MNYVIKTAHQLRKGDIVREHGGRFEIVSDLRESSAHRPEGYWPQDAIGPSACVAADSICIEGSVPGYFHPGTPWSMQGNHHARFYVETE